MDLDGQRADARRRKQLTAWSGAAALLSVIFSMCAYQAFAEQTGGGIGWVAAAAAALALFVYLRTVVSRTSL
jgi:heme/copper-type cytochrome/quinol oxidase subunit 3